MDKRYQVFVSSTYEDLKEERQQAIEAILGLNCIPAGMELFPAADDDQWTLIQKVTDDCDYYIVVVGGRYGTVSVDGVSYTEREYLYALEKNKPVLGFVHECPDLIPAGKTEPTDEGRRKLESFRSLVQKKVCKSWTTARDLGGAVSLSLSQLMRSKPAVGWVRADRISTEVADAEILRLRRHIEALEHSVKSARNDPPAGTESLAQDDDEVALRFHYTRRKLDKRIDDATTTTWNRIFAWIAPQMLNDVPEYSLKSMLGSHVAQISKLGEADGAAIEYGPFVNEEDFHKVKIQLRALGLVESSERERDPKDSHVYWRLTPYGDSMMTRILAIKR